MWHDRPHSEGVQTGTAPERNRKTAEFLGSLRTLECNRPSCRPAGQSQCPRGEIRPDHQGMLSGAHGFVWRGVVAHCDHNFVVHYLTERNCQGLANRIINKPPACGRCLTSHVHSAAAKSISRPSHSCAIGSKIGLHRLQLRCSFSCQRSFP